MAIQAVIFDIGNVLLRWQPELYYDALIGAARRREMFAEVDLHGMNERIDAGDDFRSVVYETADAHPRWAEQIRHWHDRWPELAAPEIPESGETLRELRRNGVPVFALSNIGIAGAAGFVAQRGVGALAGPLAVVALTVPMLTGTAYRVTVPVVIQIAYMRRKYE